jgi:hypothetical protein
MVVYREKQKAGLDAFTVEDGRRIVEEPGGATTGFEYSGQGNVEDD